MDTEERVAAYYAIGDLEEKITTALVVAGKQLEAVTSDDLAAFDQHHTGGKQTTYDLLSQVTIDENAHLLDIGSGIGGPARQVAAAFKCRVTGIDLTPEYVDVAVRLTRWVKLSNRVSFRQGSALDLPFPVSGFDGAYMLHVGMNIADKPALFAGVRRVLRPGAFFAIFDIMQIGTGEVRYPVGWAASSDTSFLGSPPEYRYALHEAGFEVIAERNRRAYAAEFFQRAAANTASANLPIFASDNAAERLANVLDNLTSGLIAPVEMITRAQE